MQNETEPTGRGNKRLQLAVSVLFMAAGRGAADEQRLRSVVRIDGQIVKESEDERRVN